jgi:hypothetical protein
MNNQLDQNAKASGKTSAIVAIIVLGSLCGFIEVVFSGFLKWTNFPWNAGLLTGLGLGIIAFAYAIFKKPMMAIWIGIVAILCKQLVVPVLGQSVMCKMNSCVAVMIEYSALAAIAGIAMKKMQSSGKWRLIAGGSAALVGSVGFYFAGLHIAPCNYLLSFVSASGFVSYLFKESLSWMIFSAAFVPLGWFVGEKYADKIMSLSAEKSRKFYAGAYGMAIIFWVACAIAIAQGI